MTRLEGDIAASLGRKAVAGGRVAMACVIYAAPAAAGRLEAVRAALAGHEGAAGASVMDGVLRARILAPSAISLRRCVIAVLNICRDGRALPRSWQS
jgi:urease accessory protein